MNRSPNFPLTALLTLLLVLAGCAVGPNYRRPSAPAPPAFKEQPPVNFKEAEAAGWKPSQPGDAYAKGRWWELYNDAALNALKRQLSVPNQNVQQAEAQYRQAKAAVSVARAALFPVVTAAPAITAADGGAAGSSSGASGFRKSFNLPFNIAWEPDLWGNIRRGVTASAATAQALAANLGNARLLYQAELAQDYFGLHGNDAEAELLARTQASYEESLTLPRNRFSGGVASDLDVAQAESHSTRYSPSCWTWESSARPWNTPSPSSSAKHPRNSPFRPSPCTLPRPRCRWGFPRNCWNAGRTSPARSVRWLRPTSRSASPWRLSIQT